MAPMRLNLIEGAVSFSFTPQAAQDLQEALRELVHHLKQAANTKPGTQKPWPVLEYQYTGEVFLEVFCNPNIWPTPFAAKVLITVRDERMRLTTEAELTRMLEDIQGYLDELG
ncbi:hypothetical protein RIF25_00685 [Thermosynechococcaceae cyanobacterium BACA0444]|uniref:Uncharacterized protein n=1 Tax=Pseudocalidococcus azoricus BACA0444 TaxID=2918990 RepID=A0AAE4FPU9_9CYAN|nr:hypothetical protein [Pseudocalidococcus azoricus BACA0444]